MINQTNLIRIGSVVALGGALYATGALSALATFTYSDSSTSCNTRGYGYDSVTGYGYGTSSTGCTISGSSSGGSSSSGGGSSSSSGGGGSSSSSSSTSSTSTTTTETTTAPVTTTTTCTGSEIQKAHCFARANNITTIDGFAAANPYGSVLRKHLAKMMVNFAKNQLGKTPDTSRATMCSNYTDNVSAEMKGYIKEACMMKIMGLEADGMTPLKNNDFMGNKTVTRAEYGTVLSRVLYGNKHDAGTGNEAWYQGHLQALKTNGYLTMIDTPSNLEVRGYVWISLERVAKKK